MRSVTFLLTNPRIGEKIWPLLGWVAQEAERTKVYCIGEMSEETPWYGSIDPRPEIYHHATGAEIIQGPGQSVWGENISDRVAALDFQSCDVLILDDNMENPSYGLGRACQKAREYGATVFGSPHGNQNFGGPHTLNLDRELNHCFMLGPKECRYYKDRPTKLIPGGMPSADVLGGLIQYKRDKHILVIPNFLGFRKTATPYCEQTFGPEFIEQIGLEDLQQRLGLPVIFKVKPRFDEAKHHDHDWKASEAYLHDSMPSGLDYKIVTDGDIDHLIINSACAISCASTLALRTLVARVPTIVLNKTGQAGNFYDYPYLVDPSAATIQEALDSWRYPEDWMNDTLTGAEHFNATDCYFLSVEQVFKR